MSVFEIETLEHFETTATYTVEAETEKEARDLVVAGLVPYDFHEHPGNDDRFGEIVSCTQVDGEERGEVSIALALLLLLLLIFIGSGLISTLSIAGK